MDLQKLLKKFLTQADTGELKSAEYPKDFMGYKTKVSFGMGSPARIPWIAFTAPDITVSDGYYPAYLYYKDLKALILAYAVSETNAFIEPWNQEIRGSHESIGSHFGMKVPRYDDSLVANSYSVSPNGTLQHKNGTGALTLQELESDLAFVLDEYQKVTNHSIANPQSPISQGMFYLEKQLEDFLISNWENTDLGKSMDLILEDGELKSQQYRTDIGPIDILARNKNTGSYVVIELKKGQTSDDTIGQITRYMGWVEDKLKDKNVRGIVIAKNFDEKLNYALKRVNGVEVYVYEIDFRLKEFRK